MNSSNDAAHQGGAPRGGEPETGVPAREPFFNLPGVVVWLIVICVAIHLARTLFFNEQLELWLLLRFAFIPIRYTGGYALDAYAFISPWSYAFLHGGVAHLAVNMIWLAAFGSPLANRTGAPRFLLFWLATSVAAIGLHFVLHPSESVPVVGASGAISGMMGAAARFAFRIDRTGGRAAFAGPVLSIPLVLRSRATVTFLVVWFAINLVIGLAAGVPGVEGSIAWEAHIGGFLAGFLFVRFFDRRPVNDP